MRAPAHDRPPPQVSGLTAKSGGRVAGGLLALQTANHYRGVPPDDGLRGIEASVGSSTRPAHPRPPRATLNPSTSPAARRRAVTHPSRGSFVELTVALQVAGSAYQFVEGGGLAEALAELNLDSAITALDKAGSARDKPAQVWSAVNHLEGAESALASKVTGGRGTAQWILRAHNWELLQIKRAFVLALMAVCYRYLGEEELAQRTIGLGRAVAEGADFPNSMHWAAKAAGALIAVTGVVDTVRRELGAERYAVDWAKFELPPRGLPSPDDLAGT